LSQLILDTGFMNHNSEVILSAIEPWFSVEEIARHLGVSKETVYRWLERKKIPAHRIGRLWKFKPSEVDHWIRQGGAKEDERSNTTPLVADSSSHRAQEGNT